VCQVSTTAFRAAFNGGYPIIERWPHAYRWLVEPRALALASTRRVQPYVDFKFKNDTPYHILIEAYANDAARPPDVQVLQHQQWRQVTISEPTVENVIPASRKTRSKKIPRCPRALAASRLRRRRRGCHREAQRHPQRAGHLGRSRLSRAINPGRRSSRWGTGGAAPSTPEATPTP